jgi:type VI secretion system protein ImpC
VRETKADPTPISTAGLLDQMVSRSESENPRPATVEDAADLPAFIRRVSAAHAVPKPSAAEQSRVAQRHDSASTALRAILHDPGFQALESAWRAADMLARGLETGAGLQLYLLDITLPELVEHADAIAKGLRTAGSWGVIAAAFDFGQSAVHAAALKRIAALARSAGAPFLAGARFPGGTPSREWDEFRRSPDAGWIGLALPRFLLRLPYGRDTSSIESFPFEEMPESEHGAYLWGHPAFFCAFLIGQSFVSYGWNLAGRLHQRLDDLPVHVYSEDGEMVGKPCAEVLMTEREADVLMEMGYIPIASIKGQDAAMVVRFQSVADPPSRLAGLGSGTTAIA